MQRVRDYERKHFKIEVKTKGRGVDKQTVVYVTHNGCQWSSINLIDADEVNKLIVKLQKEVKKRSK